MKPRSFSSVARHSRAAEQLWDAAVASLPSEASDLPTKPAEFPLPTAQSEHSPADFIGPATRIVASSAELRPRVATVVQLLGAILSNIIVNPTEAKFCKLALDKVLLCMCDFLTAVVQLSPKLSGVRGAIEFLEAVGFKATATHLCLEESAPVLCCLRLSYNLFR